MALTLSASYGTNNKEKRKWDQMRGYSISSQPRAAAASAAAALDQHLAIEHEEEEEMGDEQEIVPISSGSSEISVPSSSSSCVVLARPRPVQTVNSDKRSGENTTESFSDCSSSTSTESDYRKKTRSISSRVRGLVVLNGENFILKTDPYAGIDHWDDCRPLKIKKRKMDKGSNATDLTNYISQDDSNQRRAKYRRDFNCAKKKSIVEKYCIPASFSLEHRLWQRLNDPITDQGRRRMLLLNISSSSCELDLSLPQDSDRSFGIQPYFSPYILYRILHVRLAAGLVRSSFGLLNNMLRRNYDEAKAVMEKMDNAISPDDHVVSLMNVRDRLAGIWCVYAHFVVEVGRIALSEKKSKTKRSQIVLAQKENSQKECHLKDTDKNKNLRLEEPICNETKESSKVHVSKGNILGTTGRIDNSQNEDSSRFYSDLPRTNKPNNWTAKVEKGKSCVKKINPGDNHRNPSWYDALTPNFRLFVETTGIQSATEYLQTSTHTLGEQYCEYRKINSMPPSKERSLEATIIKFKTKVEKWCNRTSFEKHAKKKKVTVASSPKHQKQKKMNLQPPAKDIGIDDITSYAVSILSRARCCPLVGNHCAILLSLGRMIVSSGALLHTNPGITKVELSRLNVLDKIRSAKATCWDAIDICHDNSDFVLRYKPDQSSAKKVLSWLSCLDLQGTKLVPEKRVSRETFQHRLETMLELPPYFRGQGGMWSERGMMFNDRNSIRSICLELNRWSRLEERLESDPQQTLVLASSRHFDPYYPESELPLYSSLDLHASDVKVFEANKKVVTAAKVIWEW